MNAGSEWGGGARAAISTIAAIATPPGAGGIAIVRLSGPQAKALLARVFLPLSPSFENFRPWCLHRGRILDENGEVLDDVLAVFMPGPRTFTGEDVAEIHCHGGPFIVQTLLESLVRLGAVQAGRGEFSRRAFCNGRLDLSQAEAVAELVAAPSREALQYSLNRLDGLLGRRVLAVREAVEELRVHMSLAVDFPDEEVEELSPQDLEQAVFRLAESVRQLLRGKQRARVMECGARVVLAGAVNAGKSSLLNALLGRQRALVTDIPGTTRDFLEEACNLDGLPVRLVDTAGLRAGLSPQAGMDAGPQPDAVELLGIERSRELLAEAEAILLVVDGAALGPEGLAAETCPDAVAAEVLAAAGETPLVVVLNKSDLRNDLRSDLVPELSCPPRWAGGRPSIAVSARTGENVDALARLLRERILAAGGNPPADGLAPNARQALALEAALEELTALQADIRAGQPHDCCAVRLDMAAARLGEVTGLDSPAEVLERVFAQFCIGK